MPCRNRRQLSRCAVPSASVARAGGPPQSASTVYSERKSQRYRQLSPVVAWLAEALARNGRFAAEDRILDVATGLERMYELDGGEISHKMRTRASWFLGRDSQDRVRVMKSVRDFYSARSAIVHKGNRKGSAASCREAFDTGFDIAARTLFKLLREGRPPIGKNWS